MALAMRTLVIVLAIGLMSPAVWADGPLDVQRTTAIEKARDLRGTGATLAVFGAVSFAVSIGLGIAIAAGASFQCDPHEIPCTNEILARLASVVTAGIGTMTTVSGIPLWAIGATRARRLKQKVAVGPTGVLVRF